MVTSNPQKATLSSFFAVVTCSCRKVHCVPLTRGAYQCKDHQAVLPAPPGSLKLLTVLHNRRAQIAEHCLLLSIQNILGYK